MTTRRSMPRVGILLMDDLSEHAVHVQGGYPDLFDHLFRYEAVEILTIRVHAGDTPASLDDCVAWVIGGSKNSVYENHDWITTAEDITRRALAEERALVGFCFGHQLLAQVAGGRVAKAETGWGIGAHSYDTDRALPWFPEGATGTTLLASHQDQVVEVPGDATVWSSSEFCPNAGLLIGERAWSVQGHPEFTPPVVEALYEGRREKLGNDNVERALTTLGRPLSNEAIAAAIVHQSLSQH